MAGSRVSTSTSIAHRSPGSGGLTAASHALQRTAGAMYAIKASVSATRAATFRFAAQKTMYGGKRIARGDTIFLFASENEGGPGLVASGVVISAKAIARKPGIARQTPRVSITVKRTAIAKRRLGRHDLRPFSDWNDG